MKKKWVDNRRKNFYSEMWRHTVRVLSGGGRACENPVGRSVCDGLVETVKYIWVNI